MPLPDSTQRRITWRKRRGQHSEILTSDEFYQALSHKAQDKKEQQKKEKAEKKKATEMKKKENVLKRIQ